MKNYWLISKLYRVIEKILQPGPVIELINVLERFSQGQASKETLILTLQNAREVSVKNRSETFIELVDCILQDSIDALNKTIDNIAALYEINQTGIFTSLPEEEINLIRSQKRQMILDFIDRNEVEQLPSIFK